MRKIGFDELYVVVEDGWVLYSECLYDKETALNLADEHGREIMTLEEWLWYIGVISN